MIFGKKTLNLHISLLIMLMGSMVYAAPASICVSNPSRVQESDNNWTIARLMEGLGKNLPHAERFREIFNSNLLTQPIVKEGVLRFTPPSKLEKHVTSPFEEKFTAEGDILRYENPEQDISTTFPMQDIPTLSSFIQGLRSIFTGDLNQLRQHFHLTLTGTAESWKLSLHPVQRSGPNTIDCIQLLGTNNRIHVIEVQEQTGEHSKLLLAPFEGQ